MEVFEAEKMAEANIIEKLSCIVCYRTGCPEFKFCGRCACYVCNTCIEGLPPRCPSCRHEPWNPLRVRSVEQIIEDFALPCRYEMEGCGLRILASEKAAHETNLCGFCPVLCPAFSRCMVYVGLPELADHLQEAHQVIYIRLIN